MQPTPSRRPSLGRRRNATARIARLSDTIDFSSITGIRHASETFMNTRRNRGPTVRKPSPSSPFSHASSSSVSFISSTTARTSSETVSSFSSTTANAGSVSGSPEREAKKVRFAHPVVTAVFKLGGCEKKVQFEAPLTNTPLRSKQERAHMRLPTTAYGMNTGPICDDARAHYRRVCKCFLQGYTWSSDEDVQPGEFTYSGAVYFRGDDDDDDDEMLPLPAQDVWEEMEYGIAL